MKKITVALVLIQLLLLPGVLCAADKSFGGIGAQVVPTAGGELVVLRVVAATPAAELLKAGDLIVEVDGFALAGSDFSEVVPKRLWGAPGSPVKLKYQRPGVAGTHEAQLERVPMKPEALQSPAVRMLTPESGRDGKRP